MRRSIAAGLASSVAWVAASSVLAAPQVGPALSGTQPLRTIGAIRGLDPAEAARGLPVQVQATVTYYHHEWEMLFVQDATGAVFVYVDHRQPAFPVNVGQRVEIRGKTVPGDFVPSIASPQVRPLAVAGLPVPRAATLRDLASAQGDALWTEVRGVVRAASVVDDLLELTVMMEGGKLRAHVKEFDETSDPSRFVDAAVRVQGVCTTLTNEQRQFLGAEIWAPDEAQVVVEDAPPADPFARPPQPIESLRRLAFGGGHARRVGVAGTVILQQRGRGVFLQDETDGVFVRTSQAFPLEVGDRVEAVGFLDLAADRPGLEEALLRRVGPGVPPAPITVTAEEALEGKAEARLARVKGRFVGRLVSSGQEGLVLRSGNVVFDARVEGGSLAGDLAGLETESLVELTGVSTVAAQEAQKPRSLHLLLRSPADVVVLQRPSWWTAGRVQGLAAALAGVLLGALAWATALRRRVRRQTQVIRERLEREATLEQRYRDLVENASDIVFSLAPDGRFTSINAAAERILGYGSAELLGMSLAQIASPRGKLLAREAAAALAHGAAPHQRYEMEVVTRDERTVLLEVSARSRGEEGGQVSVEGIARDVTEQRVAEEELRRKEEALRESQQRFALAVQGTNDGIWDWDFRTDRVFYSPRWKTMLGYADEELGDAPEDWFRLVHPEDQERLRGKLIQHRKGETPHFEDEHRMLHKNGTYRWVLSRGHALRDHEGGAYRMAGAQTDVNDRRSYDPLTGLPNRALFADRLERTVARSKRDATHLFAVLFLDLDRFKFVNDSLGHLAGDQLLVELARRLEGCVRPGDVIARFGGDEFAVLVEAITGPSSAAHVAERIQKALEAPFNLGGHEVYTSASVGIALSSTGYERAEDLLRDADTAMYRAKARGRACFEVFDGEMRDRVTTFMRTENDLRRALERQELRLHFQPIVELAGGNLVALEALLRWQHPERGLLRPDEFVTVAEETGLIVPLGDWALREACRQARSWAEAFPQAARVAVCVNLSARQVSDTGLVERVRSALAASELPGERLVLEITESALMDGDADAHARIVALKELGLRLHLDDFGTGYSSLSYLHRFPIEALKIDRSFVAGMARGEEARAIVRSVLSLAEGLRLAVIAEGVETEEQLELLARLGCTLAQGYYLAPPLEPEAVEALLSSKECVALRSAPGLVRAEPRE